MHFHPPQRLPFHPHRSHSRCHVHSSFFRLLRCSELTITSSFNTNIHPTISDLAVLDDKAMSFLIKQSKTDQTKKGHFIYIFNLQSPILPYQALLAFLQLRKSQSKSPSDPLFTDDSNRPIARFWFQKHLKSVLLVSGIPANNFSSHSFRIGAATTAAQKAFPNSRSKCSVAGHQEPLRATSDRTTPTSWKPIKTSSATPCNPSLPLFSSPPYFPAAPCSCRSFSVCPSATATTTPTGDCIRISLPPRQSLLSQKPHSLFRCRSS